MWASQMEALLREGEVALLQELAMDDESRVEELHFLSSDLLGSLSTEGLGVLTRYPLLPSQPELSLRIF